ncbi:MAG: hypothetical protein IJ945_03850 [Oscillospiraceae bacterium]|nr:hypothetical protein [Oscillospiraceae bacterium]
MAVKEIFNTSKNFRTFLDKNSADFKDLFVKEVYNIGSAECPESPIFLYSGYSVIMAYLSNVVLSLNIYEKDFFIRNIRGGIFSESPDSEEFYHFSFIKSKLINDYVQSIDIKENDDGTINEIDLLFKNGQCIHVKQSEFVEGTTCSYVSE